MLYVLYVLKPAKHADFSTIGRFVNFLMMDFTVGPSLHHLFGYQISMLQMRYMCVRNFFMLVKGY